MFIPTAPTPLDLQADAASVRRHARSSARATDGPLDLLGAFLESERRDLTRGRGRQ